ncbi:T9SS type A sorting domain-containing protein [Kordia sp. YSTF-M3]|uniref:T9SS type A sorting domain-containing protein n=1 Tax=Kordia aestuariivivens TaxID=2759037 RepID=A0ABR7QDQ0_9FLAO|nr:T9SS type A sorting domain-containing protein [Kordia aestuariivivens]MBC8756689.1 T9SS type A sorting domain-containing protein [Kordia aestuariivivens]
MKRSILIFTIFLTFVCTSFGQTNPVLNLTWDHTYVYPPGNNYFDLSWDEPALPHDALIGYNVYRGTELYRFQTENSLYNLIQGANCGEDFLFYNPAPFFVHVTAVYSPNNTESTFTETVQVDGPLLSNPEFKKMDAILYPNPTSGILHIGNTNLTKILVYDISGKIIRELKPQATVDLSNMPKGFYFIKLMSEKGETTDKIIVY